MTRWLFASVPLIAAVAAAWLHFAGSLGEAPFRSIFAAASVAWFALALLAQKQPRA